LKVFLEEEVIQQSVFVLEMTHIEEEVVVLEESLVFDGSLAQGGGV
jgi:hypothetical protein